MYTSSPPRNAPSTAAVKETIWNCSLKKHKDPELKICKEPNLVVKSLLNEWFLSKILFRGFLFQDIFLFGRAQFFGPKSPHVILLLVFSLLYN